MGVGTRKPWEKFDINYERFEAVDEDEAELDKRRGDFKLAPDRRRGLRQRKLPAPAKMNDIEVGFEATKPL